MSTKDKSSLPAEPVRGTEAARSDDARSDADRSAGRDQLSGQEREDLLAAQKGYAPDVSGIPDDEDIAGNDADVAAKTPPGSGSTVHRQGPGRMARAERDGLIPDASETSAPLDAPSDSAD